MQVKQYHPDVNDAVDADKVFAEINEAHQTLSDPIKRTIYDETGMSANE
jgi:molecular chaperone DnaJ